MSTFDKVKEVIRADKEPVKPKLEQAVRQIRTQIVKLDQTSGKLKARDANIFNSVVAALQKHDQPHATVYANELAEIRKTNKTVSNAKLSMEQVQIRLNTVSELGDVVVTLSPCMSLIKGLSTSLGGMMPEVADSMQDLSSMLGDIVTGSTINHEGTMGEFTTSNGDAQSILDEAQAMVEGQTRQNMPEPPINNSIEDIAPLRRLHTLRVLRLENNDITDVSALAGLNQLKELSLAQNWSLYNVQALLLNQGIGKGDELDLRFTYVPCSDMNAFANLGVTLLRVTSINGSACDGRRLEDDQGF
jgi:division protein CdvB (Snf7/Vps24/ESCRT-III family)